MINDRRNVPKTSKATSSSSKTNSYIGVGVLKCHANKSIYVPIATVDFYLLTCPWATRIYSQQYS